MSNEIMIRMEQIVKTYYIGQPNELEILHGINLDVKRGEFVSIVGESGSGKLWGFWTVRLPVIIFWKERMSIAWMIPCEVSCGIKK